MLTHRVAVAAYIFRAGKVLLLRRSTAPCTFAPPGGKLEVGEDPLEGLRREVVEETGLEISVVGVAHTWYGRVTSGDDPLLCINFLATSERGDPRLSDEHTEWQWVGRAELADGSFRTQDEHGNGYRAASLLDAFDCYERWLTTH